MWLGAKVNDKLRTQESTGSIVPRSTRDIKHLSRSQSTLLPLGNQFCPVLLLVLALVRDVRRHGVVLTPPMQFLMAEFHFTMWDRETIRGCWELLGARNAREAASCVCMCPFQQESNISASRRLFPFCLWSGLWRYSYKDVISAECFLEAPMCAVGWRYCLVYSRLTLTLPQFYTVLLHSAVGDAKPLVWLPCCTNLKLLN